jgi:cell division protein FtsQ
MSEQKKISSKKVLRFSIGAVLVIVFMIALVAASNRQNNDTIKNIKVNLNEDHDFAFLRTEDIINLLIKSRHIDLDKTPIDKLDLKLMEEIAKTNPWVEQAEVFVDNREVLNVNITQREPIARMFDVNGRSYYMDSMLHTMPVSVGYAYPVPVFTDVPVLAKDSIQKALNAKIAYLSERIGRDSFWHAQVTQIEVQPDQTFIMIPLFGDQKLLLGDTSDLNLKLNNLFAFYKNISPKIGWDKYQTLDVRFKGQVVASPSIGWVAPKVAVDTTVADLEGPPVTAAVVSNTAPATTVAKPAVKVSQSVAKPQPDKAAVKQKVVAKPKPVAPSRDVLHAKATTQKKQVTDKKKTEKNTQSPKYIYQGKQTGNH